MVEYKQDIITVLVICEIGETYQVSKIMYIECMGLYIFYYNSCKANQGFIYNKSRGIAGREAVGREGWKEGREGGCSICTISGLDWTGLKYSKIFTSVCMHTDTERAW